jgi:type IV pilus assembly protein PilY1
MINRIFCNRRAALLLIGSLLCGLASAQTYTENFTGTSTNNSWYFINGACLTAGTSATSTAANPSCVPSSYALYYSSPECGNPPNPQFGGDTGTLPDTAAGGGGALRFTDWCAQTGAILSNFSYTLTGPTAQNLQVSFTTVTYEGDSGGTGADGADGMSFFLQDASYPANIGAFGGSLAYTCTNESGNYSSTVGSYGLARAYDGLEGGFIGLGIDEYGNFLNNGDNTATGQPAKLSDGSGEFQPGRIGLRGPGSTTWHWLSTNYPQYYPSSGTNSLITAGVWAQAVQKSCATGYVWNYSTPSSPVETAIKLSDYAAIPGAYSVLPSSQKIANESATKRSQAVPIVYNLKVTTTGLLSLSYSYNGGALQNVITNQDITQGGALPIPANVRFGFAGSTGGSRNIHEIMCFEATPAVTSQSSAGINQKQSAKVETGTQAYFAYYNPTTLAGSLTSQYVGVPQGDTNTNDLVISSTINWDGSCVLTGVPASQTCDITGPAGPITAEGPTSRTIFSWNGSTGIPFEWASLTSAEQTALDTGDSTNPTPPPYNYSRLNYLRGDRSNEQTPTSSTTFSGTFRDRASVLGDIIDSSPTWVGPPTIAYPNVWTDKYDTTGDTMAENSGQTYATFASTNLTRTNVVYSGANDGMLHAFRSGYFSTPTTYQPASNDGHEMMAYVPGYIVNSIQSATAAHNYSDPQYGHHFDVDATPGVGDVFFNGAWHTWLVGGLGPGGNAIYALDITNPGTAGSSNFSETGASPVIGEWSYLNGTTNLSCANSGTSTNPCGVNLGQTYGVPQIRRFHNGMWGAVFGNGYHSKNGDGGIYVMLINSSSGAITFYYLSTSTGSVPSGYTSCASVPAGTASSCNGIYYTAPADLDGDNITDYVYAGDLLGNVWRFDLTNTNPAKWGVTNSSGASVNSGGSSTPTALYTTPSGQPITTAIVGVTIASTGNPRMLVEFGTGQQTPMSNFSSPQYSTSQQAIYGVWDWNLGTWNASSTTKYASLPNGLVSAPATLSGTAHLQQQTIGGPYTATVAGTGSDYRTLSNYSICWADTTGCSQFGWYINLVSGNAYSPDPADPQTGNANYANTPVVWEQIIFNPVYTLGTLVVNTTIPPATAATMCFSSAASGWTMSINAATGGEFAQSFFVAPSTYTFLNVNANSTGMSGTTPPSTNTPVSGEALGATGSISTVQAPGGQYYLLTQCSGLNCTNLVPGHPQGNYIGNRATWIQKR